MKFKRPATRLTPSVRRERVAAFVNRHHVAWDVAMGVLGLGFFLFGLISGEEIPLYGSLCVVVVSIFVIEYSVRLWASEDRRQHLRANWLHAILILPLVSSLRVFAGLRAIRLVNLAKVIGHVGHVVFHNVHVFFSRQRRVASDGAVETAGDAPA
jgi:hypothetical protein